MKKIILIAGFLFVFCGIQAQEVTRGQLFRLFYEGNKAQKENRLNDAIKSYTEITVLAPKLWEPYLALGVLYSVDGECKNPELSLQSYKKYLDLAPSAANDTIKEMVASLEAEIEASNYDDDTEEQNEESLLSAADISIHTDQRGNSTGEENNDADLNKKNNKQNIAADVAVVAIKKDFNINYVVPKSNVEAQKILSSYKSFNPNRDFGMMKINGVIEIQGKVLSRDEKELKISEGDQVVSYPISSVLMIKYLDGTNRFWTDKNIESVVKEYRNTAKVLHSAGNETGCIDFLERILELDSS